jgi:hypothetical protein
MADPEYFRAAAFGAKTKELALTAFGIYAGIEMERDEAQQMGTTTCPICGKDTPHYHALKEDWRRPVAWACEIAHANSTKGKAPTEWFNWKPSLTWSKPKVPEGSMRNLRPLYALPAALMDDERTEAKS